MTTTRLAVVLALVAAPGLALLLSLHAVRTYDLGFILKTGELIARQGILTTDPFSFTRAGAPWYYEQPLGALGFYFIWRAVGLTGLIVVKAITIAAAFALAVTAAWTAASREKTGDASNDSSRSRYGAVVAAVAGMLAVSISAPRFFEQPFVFSFVLLAFTVWVLERHNRHPRWSTLAALVPVFVLWPLVHPGYFYGLALVGCYAAAAIISSWVTRDGRAARWIAVYSQQGAIQLATIAGLCGVVAFASLVFFHPQGMQCLARVWSVFAGDFYRQNYDEMRPLYATYGINLPTMALWGGPPLLWLSARRPIVPAHLFAYLVFVTNGLQVGRLVTETSLVLTPIWAASCASAVGALYERGNIRTLAKKLTPSRAAWMVVVLAFFTAMNYVRVGFGRDLSWAGDRYPRACYDWIARSHLPPRMFNDMLFGGSFIFRFYPERRVFVDGRTVYDEDFLTGVYRPIEMAAPGWRDIVAKLDIRWFLLSPYRSAHLHDVLQSSPEWQRVYADQSCVIYAGSAGQ